MPQKTVIHAIAESVILALIWRIHGSLARRASVPCRRSPKATCQTKLIEWCSSGPCDNTGIWQT